MAQRYYTIYNDQTTTTSYIGMMLKRNYGPEELEASKRVKITSFKHLLKYKEAVPPLVQLLKTQGIWSFDLEGVYTQLNKCRVEKVNEIYCYILLYSLMQLFFIFFSIRQLLMFSESVQSKPKCSTISSLIRSHTVLIPS